MSDFAVAVTPQWLIAHLADPDLTILDCRFALSQPDLGQQQYNQGHVPGAYYLDLDRNLSGTVAQHGGRHPLPDLQALAQKLSQMGVQPHSTVVAYDDSRLAFAARAWWLLRYMGHPRVAVLDGGFAGYQAAGGPVTTEIPSARSGAFTIQLQAQQAVDRATVLREQQSPTTMLIDAREGDRYRGEREPIDPVAGHIPGAVNYCWTDVTDAQGYLRSPAELQHHWREVATAEKQIVYCGSGVTACVNLLAMAAAGIETGMLYVGSWSDWCSYPLASDWTPLPQEEPPE